MLPDISRKLLTRILEGKAIEKFRIGVTETGFTYDFGPES